MPLATLSTISLPSLGDKWEREGGESFSWSEIVQSDNWNDWMELNYTKGTGNGKHRHYLEVKLMIGQCVGDNDAASCP